MAVVFRVRVVSLVLTVAVGALPIAPPEHVHESHVDGRHDVLAHRHVEDHVPGRMGHRTDETGDLTADHGDEHVVTLTAPFTARTGYVSLAPAAPLVALIPEPSPHVAPGPTGDVERLIHGPPRTPVGLRAPPVTARL